jgi:hypothetical protein
VPRIRPVAACGTIAGRATFRDQHWSATVRLNVLDFWATIHRQPLCKAALHLAETFNLHWSREGTRDANPSSAADGSLASSGCAPGRRDPLNLRFIDPDRFALRSTAGSGFGFGPAPPVGRPIPEPTAVRSTSDAAGGHQRA